MENYLVMRFPNVPENVSAARIAVATFATCLQFSIADVEEIKVLVSEAVSNAVLHAYPGGRGEITVEAKIEEGSLTITVIDSGIGISDIQKAREPGFTTAPDHIGLGFSFMESFSDSLTVESSPGKGTTVRMVKRP